MYEKDHFNQTQAEFKKEAKGQSKHAAQKKGGKEGERQEVAWYKDCPFVSSIALLLQLAVFCGYIYLMMSINNVTFLLGEGEGLNQKRPKVMGNQPKSDQQY